MNRELKRRWMRILLGAGCLIAGVAFTMFVVVSLDVGRDVRAASEAARQRYRGDAVEALICCLENPNAALRERNRAIWALGQLGDRRALPALSKRLTGQACNHANELCQHELAKAIKLLDGGINATAWIWRGRTSP
jgi:hypothetical protein